MPIRQPYNGDTRKLVIGMDMGTTYSGISYAILEPGQVPVTRGVTRFPAQEHVGGDSKIPSVLIYDDAGVVQAVGAEALQETVLEQAEDEGWSKVERFKLHLRPKSVDSRHMKPLILPPSVSVVRVYADFLRYLLDCTQKYIEETHIDGGSLWESLKRSIEYVITHPNGWEGAQQANIRQAAIKAGLVADTPEGRKCIQFLTEGEASLHFCIQNGLSSSISESGQGVIIVDAGGGTIDISVFAAKSPISFEEISAAKCYFQGSVTVTERAKEFFDEEFQETKFNKDIDAMAEAFDRTTKLRFRNPDEPAHVKFGSIRDKDPSLKIRAGQLTLEGSTMSAFFKPSLNSIMEGILAQRKESKKLISHIFLVGGFAASDYLYATLQKWLQPLNMSISRPDAHVNKAVADGAISFYVDHFVTIRIARLSYGARQNIFYNPIDCEHKKREESMYINVQGEERIPGHFAAILHRGTPVSETQVFSESFRQTSASSPESLNHVSTHLIVYRGNISPHPEWFDVDEANFSTLCKIKGDLSLVPKSLKRSPINLETYYQVNFKVNVKFGPAEMSAYLSWEENGITKTGPAEFIYNVDEY